MTAPEPDYREIVERAGDLIYVLDLDGYFTYVNRTVERLGYAGEELIGRHYRTILTPSSQSVVNDRRMLGNDAVPFFEVQLVGRDGTTVDVEVRAASMYRDGELVGRQGVARDIGELKRLQVQAAEASTRVALMEERARAAMDLYRRITQIALEPSLAPEDAERQHRRIKATLTDLSAAELGLSQQDVRIVQLLAEGCSNREIGEHIHLSPNTIKDHVRKIMRVLDARTRAEVVLRASRHGLV